MAELSVGGEILRLLPDRAAYWPAARTLLVSDLHAGKGAVLRRGGIALPAGSSAADLQRLGRLLDATGAVRLLVLGDFFHGRVETGEPFWDAFEQFLGRHPRLAVQVVAGNHDRHARECAPGGLEWLTPGHWEGGLVFHHEPGDDPHGYVLAGHLHPRLLLRGPGGDRLRVAVFWFREHHAVLPAFGSLTAGVDVRPAPQDRVFIAGDEAVLAVPPPDPERIGPGRLSP